MNASQYRLQRMGVGILLKGNQEAINKDIKDSLEEFGWDGVWMTNNPRMIAALKLCGGEVIGQSEIRGIETFM